MKTKELQEFHEKVSAARRKMLMLLRRAEKTQDNVTANRLREEATEIAQNIEMAVSTGNGIFIEVKNDHKI